MTKVWLYSIASVFSLGILLGARHLSGASAQFMGESIGLVIVLLSCQICFHLNGVDELLVESKPQIFIQKILESAGAGLFLAASLFYIFPMLSPGYAAAFASVCFLIFSVVVLRPLVRSVSAAAEHRRTIIVGSELLARKLYAEIIEREAPENFRFVSYERLSDFVHERAISRVVVADNALHAETPAAQALIDLKLRGVQIESAVDSFERMSRKIWIDGLSADRLLFTDGFRLSSLYCALKRTLDIVVCGALLLFMAPLMAIIAIVIKLETPGPAIFEQERIGFLGRRFPVYKFRSMKQDAERDTGPTWARENDDRITRFGAFLRKSRLDELPQIWNVLRGEMSLIGPRPERPYFVELLKNKVPFYDLRHYVKPGITGWAQVMYTYGASVEDSHRKLQYDLYYAKHASLQLDLLILAKTLGVVLAGEGR